MSDYRILKETSAGGAVRFRVQTQRPAKTGPDLWMHVQGFDKLQEAKDFIQRRRDEVIVKQEILEL